MVVYSTVVSLISILAFLQVAYSSVTVPFDRHGISTRSKSCCLVVIPARERLERECSWCVDQRSRDASCAAMPPHLQSWEKPITGDRWRKRVQGRLVPPPKRLSICLFDSCADNGLNEGDPQQPIQPRVRITQVVVYWLHIRINLVSLGSAF
jgi:hypothetical protein